MSRSYNEDWERRKSYLIRSLFHDIPFRALSPVPECPEESQEISTQSSETQVPQESTSSLEIYSEPRTTSSSTAPDPVPPSGDVYRTRDTRAYSPLPPLIIERMPNKHDEPPEYYQTLLNKIRLIYRKMFIEGKNLSDNDFLDSDHEKQSVMDEVFEMVPSLSELSEINHSISSDGYSADTETSDNEESNDVEEEYRSVIGNDYGRRTDGNTGKRLESDEVEVCANNNVSSCENYIQIDREVIAREQILSDEEADYRQITTQADVHIDGAQLAAVRPSPVYEEQSVQFTQMMIIHGIDVLVDVPKAISEDLATSPILPFARRPKRADVISQERPQVSDYQDANQRQTVTQTKSLGESLPEDQVSKVTTNQAFVLRFRKSAEHSFVQDREVVIQEDNEDPTPSTEGTENHSDNHIEVMRTPRPRTSVASIPLNINRHTSDMDLTCERDIGLRDISNVTSNSQDGCHDNTADSKTSCDIHDILTSIFNEKSLVNMEINESSKENMTEGRDGRKRTYEEMSQSENVSWSNLRDNFFVGTPKIFRLCSCVDHVCNFSRENQTR